jgi:hypothetical protein
VLICTDSKSLLATLENVQSANTKHCIISEILSTIQSLSHHSYVVRLLWVPSHINLQGNERADALAKLSCNAPLAPGINTPVSDLIRLIKLDSHTAWDLNWRLKNLHKGKEHAKLFPDGHLPRKTWFASFPGYSRDFYTSINRLRFAHAPTPERLFAWKLRPTPACPCTFSPGNLEHLLFACPLFAPSRQNLIACCQTLRVSQPNLLPKLLQSQNKQTYLALHDLYKSIFQNN